MYLYSFTLFLLAAVVAGSGNRKNILIRSSMLPSVSHHIKHRLRACPGAFHAQLSFRVRSPALAPSLILISFRLSTFPRTR